MAVVVEAADDRGELLAIGVELEADDDVLVEDRDDHVDLVDLGDVDLPARQAHPCLIDDAGVAKGEEGVFAALPHEGRGRVDGEALALFAVVLVGVPAIAGRGDLVAQLREHLELRVEASVQERVEAEVVGEDDVLHVFPVAPVDAGVGEAAARIEVDDVVLVRLGVPDHLRGREPVPDGVQKELGETRFPRSTAHVLMEQAFKDETRASRLSVEALKLEHGIAASQRSHEIGEDSVGDGARVGDDCLFAEVGGVWWHVDVVGTVGLLPVVVAAADTVVGHVDHRLHVVDELALLLCGQEVGDVLVAEQALHVFRKVDDDALGRGHHIVGGSVCLIGGGHGPVL